MGELRRKSPSRNSNRENSLDQGAYLKRHTESLIKSLGVVRSAEAAGRSKTTLGRYYSESAEHADRFIPIDAVAALEESAPYPHVTAALAELAGATLEFRSDRRNAEPGGMNENVVVLSQRFASLMAEYHQSIADGVISVNEARRMLTETLALQQVLVDIKMKLEDRCV